MLRTTLLLLAGALPVFAQDRPDADVGPTMVHVTMMVLDIDTIDSAKQLFEANIAVALRWKDSRLAHRGAARETRPLGDVWHPSLEIVNVASGKVTRKTLAETVDIHPDGTVIARQRYTGSFSQPMKLEDFPFDRHAFRVHLTSTRHRPEELELVPDQKWIDRGLDHAVAIAPELSLPDWSIESVTTLALPYQLSPDESRAGYALEFEAARHGMYFVWRMIAPLVLIMMMSWTVFWIDPSQSGTQISVSVTSMLTLIAFQLVIDQQVPPVSYMTRLGVFLQLSTLLVFLALVEVITTSRLANSGRIETAQRLDVISRAVFPVALVLVMLVSFVF